MNTACTHTCTFACVSSGPEQREKAAVEKEAVLSRDLWVLACERRRACSNCRWSDWNYKRAWRWMVRGAAPWQVRRVSVELCWTGQRGWSGLEITSIRKRYLGSRSVISCFWISRSDTTLLKCRHFKKKKKAWKRPRQCWLKRWHLEKVVSYVFVAVVIVVVAVVVYQVMFMVMRHKLLPVYCISCSCALCLNGACLHLS